MTPKNPPAHPDGPTLPLKDGIMIAWRPECYRSSATARTFSVPLYFVWPTKNATKKIINTFRRYTLSIVETMKIIRDTHPKTVIAYNLPPLLVLTVVASRAFNKHRIVLDFHSGALTDSKWRFFLPLYRKVVKDAPFIATHNRFDGKVLSEWGGRPIHLIALPHDFEGVEIADAPAQPQILVVCSFNADEPVDILLDAFKQCPEVKFQLTGNYKKRGLDPSQMPANIELLGYLDYSDYLRRMANSTAIITVSDRPNIMQMAVHEAISLGVPVITNESETLREVLEASGVFAELESNSLAKTIRLAVANQTELRANARQMKAKRREELAKELNRMKPAIPADLLAG